MKSIKEISKEYNISSRTIRYYEELFNLKSVKKSNIRYYDENEEKRIKTIVVFRKLNFSLSKIKNIILKCNQDNILNIINDEKRKYLTEVENITNNIMLLNELKSIITNTPDNDLEQLIISNLYEEFKNGKDAHIKDHTNRRHQVINYFFETVKQKDILQFKKYCHDNMELEQFQNFILNEIKLNETIISYTINSQYSLYNGNVYVAINTKNESITLNFVFNPNDIIVGIWVIEYKKHNA